MCARRFLIVIFILTLLVVAGGFAIYQWGGELLLRQATPKGHFEAAEAGSGPDYKDIKNWADWPDPVHGSNYLWLPGGRFEPEGKKPAATFYVHPTTYLERDRWNAPLLPPGEPFHIGENLNWAERITLFVQSQASAFNNVSEVWTPRYRQAAFGAFLLTSDDANKALDLAYGDVRAAFDEFLRIQPADKPIILAGHSQGALHLMRLIEERKARLNGRLVAAYVVGWPIDTSADLPALGFPACRAPEETGCILSWMSFGEPANPSLILGEWEKTRGPSGIEHEHERVLCVNPLSGTEGGNVPPQANPGTLVPTADLSSATLESGLVGANCRKGLLMLEGAIPAMGPYVLPGNNYHVYDYALFWAAVRNDAARRLASWRR